MTSLNTKFFVVKNKQSGQQQQQNKNKRADNEHEILNSIIVNFLSVVSSYV